MVAVFVAILGRWRRRRNRFHRPGRYPARSPVAATEGAVSPRDCPGGCGWADQTDRIVEMTHVAEVAPAADPVPEAVGLEESSPAGKAGSPGEYAAT